MAPTSVFFFLFALQLLAGRPGLGGARCSNPGRSMSTTGVSCVPFGMWRLVTLFTRSLLLSFIIFVNCAIYVLLGWPDGSLVWVLMGLFEKAISYRLARRSFVAPRALYPLRDPRWRPLVNFYPLTDDLRVCCRQYFIPGNADIARMRRHRSQTHRAFKWNATAGTPLGKIDSTFPQLPGQPRRLAGRPDFRHLLIVLDKGCHDVTLGSRFASICERCGKQIQPSLFAKDRAEIENALCTRRAFVLYI